MTPSATEDVKKVEISYMAGETVKWLATLKNSKAVSYQRPQNSTPSYLTKGNKNIYTHIIHPLFK